MHVHFTDEEWQKQDSKKHSAWVKEVKRSSVTVEALQLLWFKISHVFKRPLQRSLVMFMQPGIVKPPTELVYMTAYALQEKLTKVRVTDLYLL